MLQLVELSADLGLCLAFLLLLEATMELSLESNISKLSECIDLKLQSRCGA